eukprot:gnl/MRDRNA2_/MRDRNA2_122888_c0_seq1.p1 gnl/MRDRNA2_/MRDRNA2_122888_c0~~gnl/MRDRNA2_/MRDRNA2_122888_c0_seq1.p1  ORF type:complete len:269 (-),score=22.74 gnl/MRDRNA2_/MRDRNA2_122888_c0_seq1:454-1260(-)
MSDSHAITSKICPSMHGTLRPHLGTFIIVTQLFCAATLTCHEHAGETMKWKGQDESYIIQDFGKGNCSEGCHIMTFERCQKAVHAYHDACPATSTTNDDGELHRENWEGTPGCHVQIDGRDEISFQFNEHWEKSGQSCAEGHHPVCVFGESHSASCQIAEEAVTTCHCDDCFPEIFVFVLAFICAPVCVISVIAGCCCYRFRHHPRVQACCSCLGCASTPASIQIHERPQPHVVGLPVAETSRMTVTTAITTGTPVVDLPGDERRSLK